MRTPTTAAAVSVAALVIVTRRRRAAFRASRGIGVELRGHLARPPPPGRPAALFPVWRYHPFFTNTDLPTAQADIVHRHHAIIETVFADLIDGPLAHLPSARFGANSAWVTTRSPTTCSTPPALLPAKATPSSARGATLRRRLITVAARLARRARTPVLHLPSHWPWAPAWLRLWDQTIGHTIRPGPTAAA